MFYGRLRLRGATGNSRAPLPVPMQVEYWSTAGGNTGWVLNAADQCTAIPATAVRAVTTPTNTWQGNIAPNPCRTKILPAGVISVSNGVFPLQLAAPGAAFSGSVQLSVNLNSVTDNTCTTIGSNPVAATNANLPWLQGAWGGATYTQDPSAFVGFGVFTNTNKFIYQRENF